MKRRFFAVVLLLGAIEAGMACSEKVALAPAGAKCEYDEQCQRGLACKCVRRRNADDEGPDEIVEPGRCYDPKTFTSCPTDAGVADTAFDAPTPIDTAPEATPDAAEAAPDAAEDAPADADGG